MRLTSHLWLATVHFNSSFWARTQRAYLDCYLDVPHTRLVASKGVPRTCFRNSDFVMGYSGSHSDGLTVLVEEIIRRASDSDWMLFLDSDAFPISPFSELAPPAEGFLAVQRVENLGDVQPHPSFCLVRVDTWKQLDSDWHSGKTWVNSLGAEVTDVGGNLLHALESKNFQWEKLRRRNRINLDDLWFGLYGRPNEDPIVYHHGAGSRERISRLHQSADGARRWRESIWTLFSILYLYLRLPKRVGLSTFKNLRSEKPRVLDEFIRNAIAESPSFWRIFL